MSPLNCLLIGWWEVGGGDLDGRLLLLLGGGGDEKADPGMQDKPISGNCVCVCVLVGVSCTLIGRLRRPTFSR